jgi:P27 family predicted phage terminase small subunit
MSGPPPKPYLIKKAEGNPGKQRLTPGPEFRAGRPKCPVWVKGEARKLWKKLAPELEEQGLLALVNGSALEGLCRAYAKAVECEKVLIEQGLTYESKNGYICPRPEVLIAQKEWQLVRSFCGEFGLTPSSNGKIVVPKLKKPSLRDSLSQPDVQSRTC